MHLDQRLDEDDWVTFADDDDLVHVMPNYGRTHEHSKRCWCQPDSSRLWPHLVIHNTEN